MPQEPTEKNWPLDDPYTFAIALIALADHIAKAYDSLNEQESKIIKWAFNIVRSEDPDIEQSTLINSLFDWLFDLIPNDLVLQEMQTRWTG